MIGHASAPGELRHARFDVGQRPWAELQTGAWPARRGVRCRRSSPDFSLRTTRPRRIAISRSLLRPASISWTRPAGCTCARSCTAWRAPGTPRNTRRIGAASIPCASSFEAPRIGLPDIFSGDRHLFGTDSPGRLFLMGSDDYGRDQFSRFLHGGQISLFAGLLGAGLSLGVGMVLGGLAGFYGAWVDETIMRAAELFLALPWMYLLFAVRMALPLQIEPARGVSAGPRGDWTHRMGAPGAIDPRYRAQRQAAGLCGGGTEPRRLGRLSPAAARAGRRCWESP